MEFEYKRDRDHFETSVDILESLLDSSLENPQQKIIAYGFSVQLWTELSDGFTLGPKRNGIDEKIAKEIMKSVWILMKGREEDYRETLVNSCSNPDSTIWWGDWTDEE